ncbi:acetylglucosamine-6-sulfatase [Pseudalgibacter alginicilyticus]|uniref:Acetylglucosamine-6-sulfatase n=1 Tax=Pseudalgibacter alginicilyticus TaxID=1736674 RepID=A0A0P0CDQ5_9FLAO|nr:sulfatase [Pseudalgibacter alginicilyticus]ALJ04178.1 acetylglucosamine-6-sulfatase [Pseudalgibacter alginicilyticus]
MKKLFLSSVYIIFILLTIISCKNKAKEKVVQTPAERPNILFIMADDHTSQAWGIYESILKDLVHTPNIQRLAEEGTVLDNCLVSNSICSPSRATILTGQYSHINGLKILAGGLSPNYPTIAGVLQRGGYQTSIIGKWHLKQEPTSEFDYYCVLPGQGRYWDPVLKTKENWQDYMDGGIEYKGFSTDVIAGMTIDWIENRDKSKPFMAMCHFKATHEPFDYPERFSHLYRDQDIPVPVTFYDEGAETTGRSFKGQSIDNLKIRYLTASKDPENVPGYMKYPELPFDVDGLDNMAARYKTYQKYVKDFMRCGAAIDDNIGKILDYLDESGLAENTIVIYTADQGYFLGEHGFFDKRLIFEESIHMPFVIRYPKEIPAGVRNNDLIENVDFSALFADYAGVEYPETMQGHSFRENLKGNTPTDWRKYAYYRYWDHSKDRPGHFGIRGDRYKLAFYYGNGLKENNYSKEEQPTKFWDFYDLEKDPKETNNAYNDPQYQDIIKNMKAEILNKRQSLGDIDADNPEIYEIIKNYWND